MLALKLIKGIEESQPEIYRAHEMKFDRLTRLFPVQTIGNRDREQMIIDYCFQNAEFFKNIFMTLDKSESRSILFEVMRVYAVWDILQNVNNRHLVIVNEDQVISGESENFHNSIILYSYYSEQDIKSHQKRINFLNKCLVGYNVLLIGSEMDKETAIDINDRKKSLVMGTFFELLEKPICVKTENQYVTNVEGK